MYTTQNGTRIVSIPTTVLVIVAAVYAAVSAAQPQPGTEAESRSAKLVPRSELPSRESYDRYLWQLARHADTLRVFDEIINKEGHEPNPWARHVYRLAAAYESRPTFEAWFWNDLQRLYRTEARQELLRREAIAANLGHTLWELFHALVIYNRDAFLSADQIRKLLADAEAAKPQDRKLVERLRLGPVEGMLPPARHRLDQP